MSAPSAADPAKSSLGGLQHGCVRGADDPIATQRLPRTQRKPSPNNLTLVFGPSLRSCPRACAVMWPVLAADAWQIMSINVIVIVIVLLHHCKWLLLFHILHKEEFMTHSFPSLFCCCTCSINNNQQHCLLFVSRVCSAQPRSTNHHIQVKATEELRRSKNICNYSPNGKNSVLQLGEGCSFTVSWNVSDMSV